MEQIPFVRESDRSEFNYNTLVNKFRHGRTAAFVGAGLSMCEGVPGWEDLRDGLAAGAMMSIVLLELL